MKEGLEKASENQDNTRRISSLAFWHRIGCPPLAGSKPADLIGFLKEDSLFYALGQKCKTLDVLNELPLIELQEILVEDVLRNEETRENWIFVQRDKKVDEIRDLFAEKELLEAVLISERGNKNMKRGI